MMIGQAAGIAAKIAIDRKQAIQDIDVSALKARLLNQGAVMEWVKAP